MNKIVCQRCGSRNAPVYRRKYSKTYKFCNPCGRLYDDIVEGVRIWNRDHPASISLEKPGVIFQLRRMQNDSI